jgi:tRNA splicing endonuclease
MGPRAATRSNDEDPRAFAIARESIHALPIVDSPMPRAAFDQAVDLYRAARRAGYTVRSGVACLPDRRLRNQAPHGSPAR